MDMKGYSVDHRNKPLFAASKLTTTTTKQQQQPTTTTHTIIHSLKFSSSSSSSSSIPMLLPYSLVLLLLLVILVPSVHSNNHIATNNNTFTPFLRLKRIREHLSKINKPPLKTIQSPDGDLIDCVLSHQQPAFDHPSLKGQKPLDPPERPKGYGQNNESFFHQLWTHSGNESCPQGTIPIRRTTEKDILRSSSIRRFGRKPRPIRRDSTASGHEHAVVFVNGEEYYGAKASINVWAPAVTDQYEFSLSQIWVIGGSFDNNLNTIEAGWQVSPELYGDNYPRFFTYWTTDAYQTTGCYNLLCSGFVQTNNRIAIGAAINPRSAYNGRQFDIGIMVWKDPKHGHWWLEFGGGLLVGYWPAMLFSHLRSHANMVQFGGEIVNSRSRGYHTGTQMGSGHFAEEGFRKAAYFRNLQVVDWDNNLLPLSNIHLLADHSNCYDIREGTNHVWGTYFYYGGPGRNVRCP
ncbi:hypothetical protein PIB30_000759 [Stylosanthes scabra]|uniref:Neprosin PEP catalytic domain-containing protein n=1 Tax=Stylosanthes scabra TaxID=79078 RepID=A0ABU6Q230_9FABA|nr:hypothetical protein [Stylosanthes scabra]